jgi:chaperone required for assembly of F1-ATPase
MSDHEERRCYATMRGTRLSLNDDLEPFADGESLVIIAESEYERLKDRQIPETIDVVDWLRWIAAEMTGISHLLRNAGTTILGNKAIEIGAAVSKLAERVVKANEER